jgi:LPXTG-motif cell wall-anchored protein
VLTAPVGESITVGPFEADTLIQWRVWGGGERDYDNPSLPDLEVLLAYLEQYPGGELDATAPVAWHELTVYGCPPATPTPDRTPDATTSPTPEPTEEPTVGPDDETPAPGQGGGDQLPLTGASVPLLVGGALALALVGAGLWLLVRRRRVTFSA